MRKIMMGLILVMSQSLFAQMFEGKISEAVGIKSHLKDSPCYVYLHSADGKNAEVTMHFGSGDDFYAEKLSMRREDVHFGEKLKGYDYGYSTQYYTRELDSDKKHSYDLSHSIHTILKFDQSKDNAKFTYIYSENDGQFFNQGLYFKIECKMTKTDQLK